MAKAEIGIPTTEQIGAQLVATSEWFSRWQKDFIEGSLGMDAEWVNYLYHNPPPNKGEPKKVNDVSYHLKAIGWSQRPEGALDVLRIIREKQPREETADPNWCEIFYQPGDYDNVYMVRMDWGETDDPDFPSWQEMRLWNGKIIGIEQRGPTGGFLPVLDYIDVDIDEPCEVQSGERVSFDFLYNGLNLQSWTGEMSYEENPSHHRLPRLVYQDGILQYGEVLKNHTIMFAVPGMRDPRNPLKPPNESLVHQPLNARLQLDPIPIIADLFRRQTVGNPFA
jgi:hypothetical protein